MRLFMKKNYVLAWGKGIFFAYLLSAVFVFLLSFLMYRYDVSDGLVRGGILAAYVLSCFLGGAIVSRAYPARRFLWGVSTGMVYFVILWIVSMAGNRTVFSGFPGIIPTMVLCVFGGMLGGMFQAGKE